MSANGSGGVIAYTNSSTANLARGLSLPSSSRMLRRKGHFVPASTAVTIRRNELDERITTLRAEARAFVAQLRAA